MLPHSAIHRIGASTIPMLARAAPVAAAISAILLAGRVAGQQPSDRSVGQASFSHPAPSSPVQRVQFSQRTSQIGDKAEQDITVEMRLAMSMRRANELVGKRRAAVRTIQRRIVTATETDQGRTTAVKVHYPIATKHVLDADANDTTAEPAERAQNTQGKTYLCRREPGPNGTLTVTDESGNRPPTDEYEIVSEQMQMVGRPNLLAQFLSGRTIAVGEKVDLPNDIARQIFNLGDRFGKVTKFQLTLQNVQTESGALCAAFLANVEAISHESRQMRLEVEGPLVVEVDSCRAHRLSLVGPIGMSETRGTYSTAYQTIGTGRLQVSVATSYRDANR